MTIKALIFDIGGVLQLGKYSKPIRGHRERGVHQYIVEKLKIPIDQYFDSLDTAYADSIEGTISETKAIKTIASNLKITPKKLRNIFSEAYKRHFIINKELINYSKRLKKKGHKIAILSDQWHLSKKALITKEISKNFRPSVVSCDVGVRKPNPKIYKMILKKLKLSTKQTIFIDNQEWNLKPAKKLGMKTVLFKNNNQLFKQLEKLGIK